MQQSPTLDDRLLALEVETALKALGIAASDNEERDDDLRLAVEDLRGSSSISERLALKTGSAVAPALLVDDDEMFHIR